MEWHPSLPYTLTAASAAVATVFALALPALTTDLAARSAGPKGTGLRTWTAFMRSVAESATVIRRHPTIAFIMVQGIAVFVLARIGQINLFQPILDAKRLPAPTHGAVMSVMTAFEALASARAAWVSRRLGDLHAVFALTLLMAASLALIPFVGPIATLASLCVFSLSIGFSFPVQRQLLNDAIPDARYRATLLSIESLLDRAVCAWVAVQVGVYMTAGRLNEFLIQSALATVVLVATLLLVAKTGRSSSAGRASAKPA
jgi:hypothetical protein